MVAAVVVLLLIWAAWLAIRAVGPYNVTRAATKALASERGSLPVPVESLRRFAAPLRAAEVQDPGNPVTFELLGLMAVRGAEGELSASNAASQYMQSLALRPASPNTWASLAEAKYLEGDTSAVFEHAIRTASRLGPAEPHVQRMVAHYGLAVREEVAPATREAIDRMVGAGMRRNPLEMLQIAQRRGRLDTACRHLSFGTRRADPQWSRICQSTEARQ